MSEIQNIEERIVTYYNDLIKNNVIVGKAPVTIEWMKHQRILEGRSELDIRFGHVVVDSILGEKTPLAKAEEYLGEIRENSKYELLPKIALLFYDEYIQVLKGKFPNHSIHKEYKYYKYGFYNEFVVIQFHDIPFSIIYFNDVSDQELIQSRRVAINDLSYINNFILQHNNLNDKNYFNACMYTYIREIVYIALVNDFNEIKKIEDKLKI